MSQRAPTAGKVRAQGMRKVHPDRPPLKPGVGPDVLDHYYWYMQELVVYCREHGLPSSGQKHEVLERVRRHIEGKPLQRRVAKFAASRPAAVPAGELTLDTRVDSSYKCDARTRAFFQSVIGPRFHFTAHLQQFRRGQPEGSLTYGDLASEWLAEEERRKNKDYRSSLMHTWEYNRFVRDYMQDKPRNEGKTLKDAAKAWSRLRESRGPRDYASSIGKTSDDGS